MINVRLKSMIVKHEGTHNNRKYNSLMIKSVSNSRIYFSVIQDNMRMHTMMKKMQFTDDGKVFISFGKKDKLVIGTYTK